MYSVKRMATTLALVVSLGSTSVAAERPGREIRIDEATFAQLDERAQVEVLALKARLDELIATDHASLSPIQRKALRAEWKELKREMRAQNEAAGGTVIYISTAGIIIILLLLIILL